MRIKYVGAAVLVVAALAWLIWPSRAFVLDHACRPGDPVASVSALVWGKKFWRAQDKAIDADLAKLAAADRRHAEDAVVGLFTGKESGGHQSWRLARIRWLLSCRIAVDRRLQTTAATGP